jgi:phosphotransferase system enzyme I (PtsP)
MDHVTGVESRVLLKRLKAALAQAGEGQERLDRVVTMIAESMVAEVCSIYLRRDQDTLELCATEGLNPQSVHKTRLRVGQGLVGRIAKTATPIAAADAPSQKGFRYMAETGEEVFSSFLGVPIQRLGDILGVLVVQNKSARVYTEDEIYGLEVVAMVLAEMAELGAFVDENAAMRAPHQMPYSITGVSAQEGAAEGVAFMHTPQIVITNPVADDVDTEKARLNDAMERLKNQVDDLLDQDYAAPGSEAMDVLHAYRMFAQDRGWRKRMLEGIERGLAAEVAVEKEQSATRARMVRVPDPYLRERLHDLDDLSNRLLRILVGKDGPETLPENAILIARNIGPAELLEYGRGLVGVILEEGSVGAHAAIVARALAIPLVIRADRITVEALQGDPVLVDGEAGDVHIRPDEAVRTAFREKAAMRAEEQKAFAALRDKPARTRDDIEVSLYMNAGLMADLPSMPTCNPAGVGLFRTELQFLIRSRLPKRSEQAEIYKSIMDAAGDKPVIFRTLDIGSDKVLPTMKAIKEPNPAMGWRAIRLGLDRQGLMRMQLQALMRGAEGRPLHVMFPFIAQYEEFKTARQMLLDVEQSEKKMGHVVPESLHIGAMLETPSLAFAPRQFFEMADFISIGGNDLKQFFFAADRENEIVRRRYDTLNTSFLSFLERIVHRCEPTKTRLSFCGEDAGRPVEAACFAAMGIRHLSMRPASIGPIKRILRETNLAELRGVIDREMRDGKQSVRAGVEDYLTSQNAHF